MATRPEELTPLLGGSSAPTYSTEEYFGDSPVGLTSATHSIQSTNQDPSKSLMVIGSSSQPKPPRPLSGQLPSSYPDHLGINGNNINSAANQSPGPSGQIHDVCTDDEGEYPSLNVKVPQLPPRGHHRERENRTGFEILKQRVKSNPRLTLCIVIMSILCILLILTDVSVSAGLQALCGFYSSEVDVYSNDTVLIQPNFNGYCHSTLLAREVDARQDDWTEQQIELYSQNCDDIITFQKKFQVDLVNFTNFYGPLSIDTNRHLTEGSNLSVSVSASTHQGESSVIYTCLFDNQTVFKKWSEDNWKKYIPYAVSCQETAVSSVQPSSVNAFNFSIEKPGYYFLGLVSDRLLAHLNVVHLDGFRYLYIRNDNNRINCTLATESDSPCQIPLLSTGSVPCVLVYAKPPQDLRIGYIGFQLTSDVSWTMSRLLTAVISTIIVVIIFLVYLLVLIILCLWKRCKA